MLPVGRGPCDDDIGRVIRPPATELAATANARLALGVLEPLRLRIEVALDQRRRRRLALLGVAQTFADLSLIVDVWRIGPDGRIALVEDARLKLWGLVLRVVPVGRIAHRSAGRVANGGHGALLHFFVKQSKVSLKKKNARPLRCRRRV